jgi:hypothetical protein
VLALVGFLTISLLGPLLVVLTFALVGYVVLGLVLTVCGGRPVQWGHLLHAGQRLGGGLFRAACWVGVRAGTGAVWLGRGAWELLGGRGQLLSGILVETLCGALVGGLLGALAGVYTQEVTEAAVFGGAALGALLGFVVGSARPAPANEGLVGQAVEGRN